MDFEYKGRRCRRWRWSKTTGTRRHGLGVWGPCFQECCMSSSVTMGDGMGGIWYHTAGQGPSCHEGWDDRWYVIAFWVSIWCNTRCNKTFDCMSDVHSILIDHMILLNVGMSMAVQCIILVTRSLKFERSRNLYWIESFTELLSDRYRAFLAIHVLEFSIKFDSILRNSRWFSINAEKYTPEFVDDPRWYTVILIHEIVSILWVFLVCNYSTDGGYSKLRPSQ